MDWSQNILNIRVCVQFGTLFNEDESGSPILRDGSPYHCRGRFLVEFMELGMLSGLLAKILSFCELNWASTDKIFFIKKENFPSIRAILHSVQENLGSFHPLALQCRQLVSVGHLQRGNLRSSLTIVLTVFFYQFLSPLPFSLGFLLIHLGLLLIRSLMALILVGVRAVRD